MNYKTNRDDCWQGYLSPLKLTLLAINGVCFGGLVVVLILGTTTVASVVLTVATGMSFGALLAGAITASRRRSPPQ